ncbi:hypothetical protein MNEG_7887 [Monoraphidium neglectum]|uniref:Uncharacterized protein n=1 Tax=Monoraphidium neglectum TaxID=145388 RepID=A0A0D2MHB2_9CHLO|nr:hypothetical protein MNEG_7887 [Monoraphidium neglectum]KIZ00072.1 hypothetical protein MNEG_7887 [Monoraphidium neglectum]|eukprot:XP_013899091.1 hypothetical protein MNEG_7887 [Monoraphidium neglectum]
MRLSTTRMCASIVAVALGIVLVASGTRAQTTAGAAAPKPGEWTKPAFCKDLECPRYQVVKKISDNIELRKYEPATQTVP